MHHTSGFSLHGINKKQNLPAFAFEKMMQVLKKALYIFRKLEKEGNPIDFIINSDEVCIFKCSTGKQYVLRKGCGRVVCIDKTDEQNKEKSQGSANT